MKSTIVKNKVMQRMRSIAIIFLLFLCVGCKEEVLKEPKNLIPKDKMVDILYDLALLNVVKYQNAAKMLEYKGNELEYVYKKYNIDSTRFVQSNSYYASDYKNYKEIFDQVKVRAESKKILLDTLLNRAERKTRSSNKNGIPADKDSVAKTKRFKERMEAVEVGSEGVVN
ncbi:hypothetical protein FFWV33_06080 [Flavobacterium faecale]|uniref:DUF4296 domain-containing protein n=1 Tax=Flavobacterium faecale TaxID=1355330 RepID=A0A2S1LBP0_9FLAO|nr:DUF4296 domain-containing protein [Flavobacterium faecale]AWG21134.1 hypothetical protein FFWV33_06080 [Flavobacterium faecale]